MRNKAHYRALSVGLPTYADELGTKDNYDTTGKPAHNSREAVATGFQHVSRIVPQLPRMWAHVGHPFFRAP